MADPNLNKKLPYLHLFEMYHWDRPPMPAKEDVQRPERPNTPSPAPPSSSRSLGFRRRRTQKPYQTLVHIHRNGLRTRMPTCPNNATCVGIDDIGEYMYNQAKKSKQLKGEDYRMRDNDYSPFLEPIPYPYAEHGDHEIGVVAMGPPPSVVVPRNSRGIPPSSEHI